MYNKCAKQTVVAVIVKGSKLYWGFNACKYPQEKCPREGMKSGEGYELCKSICGQSCHAEVAACHSADIDAKGGMLYLFGHTYCCPDCIEIMNVYGIKGYKVVDNLGEVLKNDEYV